MSEEERQERENELTKKLSLVETTHLMLLAFIVLGIIAVGETGMLLYALIALGIIQCVSFEITSYVLRKDIKQLKQKEDCSKPDIKECGNMAYYWCSLTFDKVGTLLERNSIVYGETEQEFIRKCPYKTDYICCKI